MHLLGPGDNTRLTGNKDSSCRCGSISGGRGVVIGLTNRGGLRRVPPQPPRGLIVLGPCTPDGKFDRDDELRSFVSTNVAMKSREKAVARISHLSRMGRDSNTGGQSPNFTQGKRIRSVPCVQVSRNELHIVRRLVV